MKNSDKLGSNFLEKKILFLVPDGVGIRNYLFSNIIHVLKDHSIAITIWSPMKIEAFSEILRIYNNVQIKNIDYPKESFFSKFYRELSVLCRLKLYAKIRKNDTLLSSNWLPNRSNFLTKTFYRIIDLFSVLIFNYQWILKIENKVIKNWSTKVVRKYENDLVGFDKIFITHQRVSNMMPITIAAQNIGVEVISVIYSWDNVPKARLSIKFDKLMVWSDYMKNEMRVYYPEINPENIIVSGTPQFEFYNDHSLLIDRNEFSWKYGLNPNKNWILFSGSDVRTSPFDPLYLEDIAKYLVENQLQENYSIILRQSPGDLSGRYEKVIYNYPNVIKVINPLWVISEKGWNFNYPLYEDVKLLVNTVYHSLMAINMGSTIAHDFAMFNKKCLYINYNIVDNTKWNVESFYKHEHFKSMPNSDSVIWLNNIKELKGKLEFCSEILLTVNEDNKSWLNVINQFENKSGMNSSEIISNCLLEN